MCPCPTIELGCALQRLFSIFPDGLPGLGLLLLRLGTTVPLLGLGVHDLLGPGTGATASALDLAEVLAGAFLLVGLWTPLIGAFAAINQLWIAAATQLPQYQGPFIHAALAVQAAGLALLGPGAWSIDARLFGRKRFVVRASNRKSSL